MRTTQHNRSTLSLAAAAAARRRSPRRATTPREGKTAAWRAASSRWAAASAPRTSGASPAAAAPRGEGPDPPAEEGGPAGRRAPRTRRGRTIRLSATTGAPRRRRPLHALHHHAFVRSVCLFILVPYLYLSACTQIRILLVCDETRPSEPGSDWRCHAISSRHPALSPYPRIHHLYPFWTGNWTRPASSTRTWSPAEPSATSTARCAEMRIRGQIPSKRISADFCGRITLHVCLLSSFLAIDW